MALGRSSCSRCGEDVLVVLLVTDRGTRATTLSPQPSQLGQIILDDNHLLAVRVEPGQVCSPEEQARRYYDHVSVCVGGWTDQRREGMRQARSALRRWRVLQPRRAG